MIKRGETMPVKHGTENYFDDPLESNTAPIKSKRPVTSELLETDWRDVEEPSKDESRKSRPVSEASPAEAQALLDQIAESAFGIPVAEIKEQLDLLRELKQDRDDTVAAQDFMNRNPDYIAHPQNYQAIQSYLNENGMTISLDNLQTAYDDLRKNRALPVTHKLKAPSGLSSRDYNAREGVPARSDYDSAKEMVEHGDLESARAYLNRQGKIERQRQRYGTAPPQPGLLNEF